MADHRDPIHVVGLLGGRPVGPAAAAAVGGATLLAGGASQLDAVADLTSPAARTVVVGAGLSALDALDEHRGPMCVLASGDPGFHGITRTLAARFGPDRLVVHPAPSSVALAFARLGLPWHDARVASCHNGPAARAAAEVATAATAAVLCGPGAPPEAVGAALMSQGAHHQLVVVATRLGEPGETVTRMADIASLAAGAFDHRSVVVLAHPAAPVAPGGRPGGRPTVAFAHRAGMITKPEVRSVVLGHLDLPDRGVLWDVGAGSASIAIEAALAAPGLRVLAIERDPAAAATAIDNAAALGALVEVVEGSAPGVLDDLPRPDRVFVGGGGIDVLDRCRALARPGARIVATYAAIDRALAARRRLGSLAQVSIDRSCDLPDGGVRFVADNPVFVAWGDGSSGAAADPPHQAVGIGCSSQATADDVATVVAEALATAGTAQPDTLATIDRRAAHPAVRAQLDGRPLVTFPSALLAGVAVPNPSEAAARAVGTPSVAEAAALLAAGPGARLAATKHRGPTATAAVAVGRGAAGPGSVRVVGLGPGAAAHRTPAAVTAVRSAGAVIGYERYVDAASSLLRPDQMVLRSPMGAEAERAEAAVALAEAGWSVALVSSGDPGVFAMASVTLEVAAGRVAVEVIPGVTSANAAAAIAGAPLAGPHAALTLSDLLLPWSTIEAQLRAAAASGLSLALFNPRSQGRPDHLHRARTVLAEVIGGDTPVALVTKATAPTEALTITSLDDLDPGTVGMNTMVLVGTADTAVVDGRIVARRHHRDGARPS